MSFYPSGQQWKDRHKLEARLYGQCAMCGREKLKRLMYTVFIRKPQPGDSNPKTLTHLCRECMPALLDFLAVSEP